MLFRSIEGKEDLFKALEIKRPSDFHIWLEEISNGIVDLKLRSFGVKNDDVNKIVDLSFTLGRMDNNPYDISPSEVKSVIENLL